MGVVVRGKRGPVRADAANVVRGQRTRERLLHCARERILAKGFEALRLDDLARDAEVTKAAVVRSVGGKPTILLALGDEDRQTRARRPSARRTRGAPASSAASRTSCASSTTSTSRGSTS